jgi:hypothetical protein
VAAAQQMPGRRKERLGRFGTFQFINFDQEHLATSVHICASYAHNTAYVTIASIQLALALVTMPGPA